MTSSPVGIPGSLNPADDNNNSTEESPLQPEMEPAKSQASGRQRKIKMLSAVFGVQAITQAMGLIAGLLLVRTLSQEQYALFTIAGTMQGTLSVLADSGVNSALSARGGQVWQDRRRFGELVQTCLSFRRKFGALGFLVVGPILFWMLFTHHAGLAYSALLTFIVASAVSIQLTHGILVMVPRLKGRVKELQMADLASGVLRLLLIGAVCLLYANAALALLTAVAALALQNYLYKKWAKEDVDLNVPTNDEDRSAIWKSVRHQAPIGIYYCFSGQLTVFLISFFGNTQQVASIGALGRLSVIFTVISSVMSSVVLPHVARCQNPTRLRQLYCQVLTGYAVIGILFLLLALLVPQALLWVLGSKYGQLQGELQYSVLSSVLSSLAGAMYSMNSTRAWLEYAWLNIPISIGAQAILLPILNLSTIQGVLLLTIIPLVPLMMLYAWNAHVNIRKMALNPASS